MEQIGAVGEKIVSRKIIIKNSNQKVDKKNLIANDKILNQKMGKKMADEKIFGQKWV